MGEAAGDCFRGDAPLAWGRAPSDVQAERNSAPAYWRSAGRPVRRDGRGARRSTTYLSTRSRH